MSISGFRMLVEDQRSLMHRHSTMAFGMERSNGGGGGGGGGGGWGCNPKKT